MEYPHQCWAEPKNLIPTQKADYCLVTKGYDFSLHCFPVSRPTHSTEIAATRGQVLGTLQKVCLVKTQIC